jgi:hypothetical protein
LGTKNALKTNLPAPIKKNWGGELSPFPIKTKFIYDSYKGFLVENCSKVTQFQEKKL